MLETLWRVRQVATIDFKRYFLTFEGNVNEHAPDNKLLIVRALMLIEVVRRHRGVLIPPITRPSDSSQIFFTVEFRSLRALKKFVAYMESKQ